MAPVNAEPHNTYVSSLLLLLRVFRDSTAHGPSPSHPSTRGTTGIPLSGPVEGSELEFLYASRNPFSHFVTAVTCAALDPVRRASCTSKKFLSMYWTCFSFRCAQRIRKKLVQLRRGRPQSEYKSRAAFHDSTSSTSRPETSSPRFNSTCHFLARGNAALRKHLEATQHSEIVDFLCLELRRWTAEARDARVEAFFDVLTSCRTPDGTRITRPLVVWFPACVVQDRTLRNVVASVRSNDVSVTCAR